MNIKRFGENKTDKWIETADGIRHKSNESQINAIWWYYIYEGAKTVGVKGVEEIGGYNVFEFNYPVELNITELIANEKF